MSWLLEHRVRAPDGCALGRTLENAPTCDRMSIPPVPFVGGTDEGETMAKSSPWPYIHAERDALIADLEGLTDEQWATPSLCTGWTVRDVVGHLISTAKVTPPKFFAGFIGSGFKFHAMSAKEVAR